MGVHVAFDLRLELGHGLAARHEVGDLLAGLLALEEVGGQGAADEHREMIADGHRVDDLVGDEDHREAALARPPGAPFSSQPVIGAHRSALRLRVDLYQQGCWDPRIK